MWNIDSIFIVEIKYEDVACKIRVAIWPRLQRADVNIHHST